MRAPTARTQRRLCSAQPVRNTVLRDSSAAKTASSEIGYDRFHDIRQPILTRQATHKILHKLANSSHNPFPTYDFSGPLRPVYPLSPTRQLPDSIQRPDYAGDGFPRSERVSVNRNKIRVLNKEEQDGMRKVCRLAREVLDLAAAEVRPGITTDHIDQVVHDACIERNVR